MEPRPGERFEKGDVLVRFVCDRFVAQRDSAKAALNAATKRLESVDKLVAMRSASVLDRDIAQADVDAREAELRLFQADVNRCAIRAPYSGRVVSWYANPHEVSDVGVEIMEVVADGALEVEMIVPSGWLRWLEPGMPISLSVDETGDAFDLSLSVLGAEVDPVSQTVGIRARFTEPPKTLIPGMSGIAIFPKQDNS